jgi:hypothetical protein
MAGTVAETELIATIAISFSAALALELTDHVARFSETACLAEGTLA